MYVCIYYICVYIYIYTWVGAAACRAARGPASRCYVHYVVVFVYFVHLNTVVHSYLYVLYVSMCICISCVNVLV